MTTTESAVVRVREWRNKNRDRYNSYQMQQRVLRRTSGLCSVCRNPLTAGSPRFCVLHWIVNLAKREVSATISVARQLLEKLESQEYRCPYSGRELVPGINCHLDHIKPVSAFPELAASIDNLQWVDATVNRMKSNMTEDEFLGLCSTIANRRSVPEEVTRGERCRPKRRSWNREVSTLTKGCE